ncbi:ribbon-helix-helix protein, CopG family [Burkholderia ubonensis]|uniref:ribbon-helix-helix protein, CopG family n=1 Tax=Burkholderia ubonensis TaxID=101571 RepID=UPI000B13B5C0|nr:ribbon-helix-helix protein, CopG family [Burkholderia ubonensis]
MSRISLTISEDANKEIEALAKRENITKAEAMRRALSLVKIANKAHKDNQSLALIREDGANFQVVAKLIGV